MHLKPEMRERYLQHLKECRRLREERALLAHVRRARDDPRAAEHAAEAAFRDLAPHGHLEAAVEGHGPLDAKRPDPGEKRRQPLDEGAAHGDRGGPTPTPTHGRNGREVWRPP
mgnify:CR=1 FL=1